MQPEQHTVCTREREISEIARDVGEIRDALLGDFSKQGLVGEVKEMHTRVDRVFEKVFGNGVAGLVARVAAIETGQSRPTDDDGKPVERRRRPQRTPRDLIVQHGTTGGIVAAVVALVELLKQIGILK